MPEQCGDRLDGLYEGITLACRRDAAHPGRHEDDQLGPVVQWTDNAYGLIGTAA